jgi:glycosyltransferase involved in cell wall biosynthesis
VARINQLTPSISIGLPVYNGERDIRNALDSIIGQTYEDFELVISDNASTDDTARICKEYAERDPRVKYFRQPTNIGGTPNFRFVLLQARGEYFVWAGADDVKSPDFLAENLAFLQSRPEYLGSTSPVRFRGQDFDNTKMGCAPIDDDDPCDRITKMFLVWHANGRFYSLFRREAVLGWPHLNDFAFLGSDWTLPVYLAKHGKLHMVAAGWVELGTDGISSRPDVYARFRRQWIEWVLPLYVVTLDALRHSRGARLSRRLHLLSLLLSLNYAAVAVQFHRFLVTLRTRRKAIKARIKNQFRLR